MSRPNRSHIRPELVIGSNTHSGRPIQGIASSLPFSWREREDIELYINNTLVGYEDLGTLRRFSRKCQGVFPRHGPNSDVCLRGESLGRCVGDGDTDNKKAEGSTSIAPISNSNRHKKPLTMFSTG